MDINKFTMKSQEALRKSQELALSLGQQQVDVFHLLSSLISQDGSVVPTVLRKIGVDIEKIKVDAMKEAEKYPKASGGTLGQIFITPSLVQIQSSSISGKAKSFSSMRPFRIKPVSIRKTSLKFSIHSLGMAGTC